MALSIMETDPARMSDPEESGMTQWSREQSCTKRAVQFGLPLDLTRHAAAADTDMDIITPRYLVPDPGYAGVGQLGPA
jgi:hypothetical protein